MTRSMLAAGFGLAACLLWSPASASARDETAGTKQSGADDKGADQADVSGVVRIEVTPAQFELASPRRQMHLVVTGYDALGHSRDLTHVAEIVPSNPQIVAVKNAVARPQANGQTIIRVRAAGQEVSSRVTVRSLETPEAVSFRFGTLAALTKQGCNQGACHGSPSGKGGFRLSLRAYDPVLDADTLVREAFARRTNVAEPQKSLLLQKPLMEVAHGGGRRITTADPSYALLRDWIAEGCRIDADDAPQCLGIEIFPKARVLHHPAHTQQLVVLAKFSDGSTRDVTHLADYSSSDEAIATVNGDGLITGHERGESAVLVRYLEFMQTSSLMFLRDVEGFRWPDPAEQNFIDQHVLAKLRTMQIVPSETCTDEEFVRRVYLDVIGLLPTVVESQAFLNDKSPNKRAKLIDSLLERPEHAEFWALKWSDLLRVRSTKLSEGGMHKFHRWIVSAVRDNMPYDEFARSLLLSAGGTLEHPAASYYRAAADTIDCTETTCQLFLGIRIQCAKCHNHPFERWTQDNYYGIGAFFHRVQRKKTGDPDNLIVWVSREGEITQPRTGATMQPWLPLKGPADVSQVDDRREALADWLTAPDNPFFARMQVNRLWGHLMGRGIVEPVDDFRESNPPSNAALLDALAKDFVAHGFDCRHTIRTILNSRAYQLSSRANPLNENDEKYFSHARTRLLAAEQLLDAISRVTEVRERFAGLPESIWATQLPSPDVNSDFLKTFGQPARETACQCERSGDSNLSQALQMINGPLVHAKLRSDANRIRRLVKEGKSDGDVVRELYLSALSREPSPTELQAATRHIGASEDRLRGLEDVCWALLNANEFLFQH